MLSTRRDLEEDTDRCKHYNIAAILEMQNVLVAGMFHKTELLKEFASTF